METCHQTGMVRWCAGAVAGKVTAPSLDLVLLSLFPFTSPGLACRAAVSLSVLSVSAACQWRVRLGCPVYTVAPPSAPPPGTANLPCPPPAVPAPLTWIQLAPAVGIAPSPTLRQAGRSSRGGRAEDDQPGAGTRSTAAAQLY